MSVSKVARSASCCRCLSTYILQITPHLCTIMQPTPAAQDLLSGPLSETSGASSVHVSFSSPSTGWGLKIPLGASLHQTLHCRMQDVSVSFQALRLTLRMFNMFCTKRLPPPPPPTTISTSSKHEKQKQSLVRELSSKIALVKLVGVFQSIWQILQWSNWDSFPQIRVNTKDIWQTTTHPPTNSKNHPKLVCWKMKHNRNIFIIFENPTT